MNGSHVSTGPVTLANVSIGPLERVGAKDTSWLGIQNYQQARTYRYEVTTTTSYETCEDVFLRDPEPGPPNPEPGPPDPRHGYWMWETHVQRTSHTTRESMASETITTCRLFDPPYVLPPARFSAGPVLFLGDLLQVEQTWLRKLPEVLDYKLTLDGQQQLAHLEKIDLSSLGVGYHFLDLEVTLKGRNKSRYQGSFNVRNKLDVSFEQPVQEIRLAPGRANGAVLRFEVTNQSRRPLTAFISVEDVPHGWKAMMPDDPIVELGPGRKQRFRLQVEMMVPLGYSDQPVPFVVSARTPLSGRRIGRTVFPGRANGTAFVAPRVTAAMARRFAAQQKWARRHQGVLPAGTEVK